MAAQIHKQNRNLETLVGNTLRFGVWISFALTLMGLIIILVKKPDAQIEAGSLPDMPEKFSFKQMFAGILNADAAQISMLGIFILLITPLLRVLFALFGYLKEGNRLYFLITAAVLTIIAISAWIGAAH